MIPEDIAALVREHETITRWGLAPHPAHIQQTWWYALFGAQDVTVIESRLKASGWPEAFYKADRTVYLRRAVAEECRDDEMHALLLLRRVHTRMAQLGAQLQRDAAEVAGLLRKLEETS